MPLERLGDWVTIPQTRYCFSPKHNPPTMMVYEPGSYKYTCPDCGHVQYFHVRYPRGLQRLEDV